MKKILKQNKGFSLVELLIALLIMAVIAGTAITLFGGVLETSKGGADKETAATIKRAILTYMNASNDIDLGCLGIANGDNSSELITALSKKTTINASSATNGTDDTTWSSGDMQGEYGPFLEKSVIAPTQNGKTGWAISINAVTQVISVEAVSSGTTVTITTS